MEKKSRVQSQATLFFLIDSALQIWQLELGSIMTLE
jgi:hypothetical protein